MYQDKWFDHVRAFTCQYSDDVLPKIFEQAGAELSMLKLCNMEC